MAGSQIERAFRVVERLTHEPRGLSLQSLAEALDLPKSAAHRLLTELTRLGYVRQNAENLRYLLTTRLVAQGFRYLGHSGVDIVQPILDRLAEQTAELIRLGVVDGARLTWLAKAQGARSGLRYDPDMGREAPLFYTASGHAWLATLNDDQAMALVEAQGIAPAEGFGPNAPRNTEQLLARLRLARAQGYAWVIESSAVGMSALAVAVRHPDSGATLGVLSVAGPTARLPEARLHGLAPATQAAAVELAQASMACEWFR
ncbi:IclR family transcriptional regulator [Pseudomonas massiliensis]|uniref:IclR family transcriptional regulator n=1 Tax=Pseudomonas massiliensis TaxID=522492 RepID=UPI00058BF8E8|nr:IclR family transcriptional regulator [Pseudomonas massiliensis]